METILLLMYVVLLRLLFFIALNKFRVVRSYSLVACILFSRCSSSMKKSVWCRIQLIYLLRRKSVAKEFEVIIIYSCSFTLAQKLIESNRLLIYTLLKVTFHGKRGSTSLSDTAR